MLGFNVIGYVSANVGLGVSARHVIRLLIDRGFPVAIFDMDPGLHRTGHDQSFSAYTVASPEDLPYSINLVFLFIPQLPTFLLDPPPKVLRRDRLNVAFVWWELTVLPKLWIEALQLFDVVVAGSNFVYSVLEAYLSNVRIICASQPIYLPAGIAPSRGRFALPEDVVIFASSFEPHSDPERKNPIALVDAFLRAFKNDERAILLIRLNNAERDGVVRPSELIKSLTRRSNGDPRIRFSLEPLSYAEAMALYGSCDVFVSLHRSEGLGLGPMEAMMLGKPVIATGWSGNLTYMNHTNSCLVGYRLVPVTGKQVIYTKKFLGESAEWADPDVSQAAAWMQQLANDPALRLSIGKKAATDMSRFQQDAERGGFLEELAAITDQAAFLDPAGAPKWEDMRALRRAYINHNASPGRRFRRKAKDFLDRHIGWRFTR